MQCPTGLNTFPRLAVSKGLARGGGEGMMAGRFTGMKWFCFLLLIALAGCSSREPRREAAVPGSGDAAFNRLADEYLTGYLAWRPLEAVQLGCHQYDGKLTDYSRASIDGELLGLRSLIAG